jgi:hypothetical protein
MTGDFGDGKFFNKKTAENRPFVRADKNVPMHQIKPGLRHQDLEGIHLPSFRFSSIGN